MFNKILVAYDGSPSSRAAIQQAYALARANSAQVTILSVAPSVAALAGLSGVSIEELGTELNEWAEQTAREGASTAPSDANVHTITRSGHVGEEIVAEIEAGGYDLAVLRLTRPRQAGHGPLRKRQRLRPLPLQGPAAYDQRRRVEQ